MLIECTCDMITLLECLANDLDNESDSSTALKVKDFTEKLLTEIKNQALKVIEEQELERYLELGRTIEATPAEDLDDDCVHPHRFKKMKTAPREPAAKETGFTDPNIAALVAYNLHFAQQLLERSYSLYQRQPDIPDEEVKLFRHRLIFSCLQIQLINADMEETLARKKNSTSNPDHGGAGN